MKESSCQKIISEVIEMLGTLACFNFIVNNTSEETVMRLNFMAFNV